MRFVNGAGTVVKARRAVYGGGATQALRADTPEQLSAVLAELMSRVSDLEAQAGDEATEFEKDVGAGGAAVKLYHGFGKPVRYYVTYWTRSVGGAYPTTAPILVAQADSTSDELSLKSYVAGRAIIRVEAAQAGIDL